MVRPTTIADLAEAVAASNRVIIQGTGTAQNWRCTDEPATIDLSEIKGVIDYSPDDQVISVRAGTKIADLQNFLAESAQCLPLAGFGGANEGTVGGAISLNIPHLLEDQCGTWRDWVLGITAVQHDGTIAKSGSHAVKNVAGYDLHRFAVGSRGTLFAIAEVILRTYPIKSLPPTKAQPANGLKTGNSAWIQRVLRSDFEAASQASAEYQGYGLPEIGLLFRMTDTEFKNFPGQQLIRSHQGPQNTQRLSPSIQRLTTRTRHLFDPKQKFSA